MHDIEYNRKKSVEYAKKWAYGRNKVYYDFEKLGGDCTNFISQSLYAGCNIMNYNSGSNGWFYKNSNNHSPSWTGVQFLYNFLTLNKSVGPYGTLCDEKDIEIGDIAQIRFNKNFFTHSTVIVNISYPLNLDNILISTHSINSNNRPLSTYKCEEIRFIHIIAARKY